MDKKILLKTITSKINKERNLEKAQQTKSRKIVKKTK